MPGNTMAHAVVSPSSLGLPHARSGVTSSRAMDLLAQEQAATPEENCSNGISPSLFSFFTIKLHTSGSVLHLE